MGVFTWLDAVIAVFFLLALLRGVRAGLIRSFFSILSIAAGIGAAAGYYAALSTLLLKYAAMPIYLADLLSFALIFLAAAAAVTGIGALFATVTRFRVIRVADRIGGAAAGLLIGIAVAGIILVLLSSFPLLASFQDRVDESRLAPALVESGRGLYDNAAALLPVALPDLAFHPEQLLEQLQPAGRQPGPARIDFRQLDGATCFVCGDSVAFEGYLANSLGSLSPKFTCAGCGRTSDGCQTFEGHHLMYGQCPVVLGRRGYRFDCGIWSNASYHRPAGTCPVCGESS